MFFSRASEKGMGLVEVMVASVMLLAIVGGIGKYLANMQKAQNQMTAVSVRNGKVNVTNAILEAGAPRIVSLSINNKAGVPFCPELAACVINAGACPKDYGSCDFRDVGGTRVTGSDSNPVRITLDGRTCSNASAKCPLEVIGRFRRSPANNADLEVWTVVQQAPGVKLQGMPALQPFNADVTKGLRSVVVPLAKISHKCADDEKLVGYEANGTFTCQPVVAAKDVVSLTAKTALPKGSLTCKDGEYMSGITPAGTPVCGAFPHTWQTNNAFTCIDNSPDPLYNCATLISNVNAFTCPKEPHGIMCEPSKLPSAFCAKVYKTGVWGTVPTTTGGNSLDIKPTVSTVSRNVGPFVTGCWSTGTSSIMCNSGSTNVNEVSGTPSTTNVPLQEIKMIHMMRCVPLVRASGSTF